jgi:hypothetical protein
VEDADMLRLQLDIAEDNMPIETMRINQARNIAAAYRGRGKENVTDLPFL